MALINFIEFNLIGDQRGSLISLESNHNIPFEIKRVYYLFDLNSEPRGFHAHKKLKQVAICINGSCEILMNDGFSNKKVTLNSASQGLLIDVFQWHEMSDFSVDCVLMVLASDYYDESDYIRDYDDFLKEVIL